jgi:hypothetical protein
MADVVVEVEVVAAAMGKADVVVDALDVVPVKSLLVGPVKHLGRKTYNQAIRNCCRCSSTNFPSRCALGSLDRRMQSWSTSMRL